MVHEKNVDFSPKPILFRVAVISSSPYSPPWNEGVRNLIRRLIQDFSQRDVELTVITSKAPDAQSFDEPKARLIQFAGFHAIDGRHTWFTALTHILLLLRTSWAVRKLKPAPDIILLFASVTSLTGLRVSLLKLASRKPVVLYVTGLASPRWGYNLGIKADKVIVGSDFLQDWFPGAEVVYPFLPLSVKTGEISPGKDDSFFNVAFLGSFESGRGVEFLLQAMALVKARTTQPVRLTIGWNGTGADNYPEIIDLIDKLDLRFIVTIHGEVDTTQFYRQADILVIPRLSQKYMSFPVRIVEAMKMQTPLVVTRVCGMENLIEGCGLSIKPGDVHGLADAILELIDNPGLRAQFRQNCESVSRRFDSQISLDRVYRILGSLVRND